MKEFNKKIITLVLVAAFVFAPMFARKAEAQWVVIDPSNLVQNIAQVIKDYGLDSLAWMIANTIIERMAASTVNWINSGFEGSPAYVTDPESYFQNMGDQIAAQYIFSNPNLNYLCGPISARIRLTLTRNYLQEKEWQCTLTDVMGNMEDFMGDFDRGGWDKFFEMTQKPQNNPLGAYLQAENEMSLQIATRQGTKKDEANWGNGFMSWKECEQYGEAIPARTIVVNGQTINIPASPGVCIRESTKTPGSVIQKQLDKQLGAGQDKLVVADEINEIVSALLNQLVSQVVGGIGRGLRGLSNPSPTGGSTFTTQLNTGTTTDYFGNTQDTTILDQTIPDPFGNMPPGTEPVWPPQGASI